jgi:hypothetical protein
VRRSLAGDVELHPRVDILERERLAGTASLVAHFDAVGALRPRLTVDRAGHRLWAINSGETGDALVLRCRWSLDEYEDWMTEMMTAALLRRPPKSTPHVTCGNESRHRVVPRTSALNEARVPAGPTCWPRPGHPGVRVIQR